LDRVVAQAAIFAEVLVLDDGSKDGTLDTAVALAHEYPNLHIRVFTRDLPRPTFGGLIRLGMAHASGRYCAIVSADGSDPAHLLPHTLPRPPRRARLPVCSRYTRPEDPQPVGSTSRLSQSISRRSIKVVLGQEVTDSTYGFRAFNRISILALGTSSSRFNIFP